MGNSNGQSWPKDKSTRLSKDRRFHLTASEEAIDWCDTNTERERHRTRTARTQTQDANDTTCTSRTTHLAQPQPNTPQPQPSLTPLVTPPHNLLTHICHKHSGANYRHFDMSSIREMLPQLARDALAQVDDSEYERRGGGLRRDKTVTTSTM